MIITEEQLKSVLLELKIIDKKDVTDIEQFAENSHATFEEAIIEKNIISDENLGIIIANVLKIPFVSLAKISIPEEVFHIVPEKTARRQKVLAFARDASGIKVAMADPNNKEILELIKKKTGSPVIAHFATERDINNAFYIFKKDLQKAFDDLLKTTGGVNNITDAPVAKIVDLLIDYAYLDKTSDIHIEPQEKNATVRFRIDGILHDVLFYPKNLHDRITTRIKVLSRLRTDEHLSAQDGKMRMKMDSDYLDLRVSIIPIVDGEKIVMRLLSADTKKISLIDLGMNEKDLEKVSNAFNRSFGMILSTGPTGSGKSTSIYSILKILNTREKNITTIEDPVEYRIKGVNQIQVNTKTNLTFAAGLRSILRQDPNVVFVGEIRDSETAGIAVNAALTGHLVLSTLHTNDAATALPRLTDMNIEPFLVASTVNIIIAQRLIRKICDMCKTTVDINQEELTKNIPLELVKKHFGTQKQLRIYRGAGCKICHSTGYSGRLGVFEVLEINKEIKELITKKVDSDAIAKKAIDNGMTTMLEDGLNKIAKGMTTLEEVLRVTKVEAL